MNQLHSEILFRQACLIAKVCGYTPQRYKFCAISTRILYPPIINQKHQSAKKFHTLEGLNWTGQDKRNTHLATQCVPEWIKKLSCVQQSCCLSAQSTAVISHHARITSNVCLISASAISSLSPCQIKVGEKWRMRRESLHSCMTRAYRAGTDSFAKYSLGGIQVRVESWSGPLENMEEY